MMRTVYEFTPEMYDRMKQDAAQVAEQTICSRFADRLLDAKAAAQVLGVSIDTVRNYVSIGRLKPEPRVNGGALRFRLSYLLEIDVNQIKYQRT